MTAPIEAGAALSRGGEESLNPKGRSKSGARRSRGSGPELTIQNPCQYREAGARRVRPWLERLLASLAADSSAFVVRFVSDREMRQLNRVYRDKDATTDVLSFPGERRPDGHYLGDVVISVPAARRQAAQAGHGESHELKVLMLHGLLHCLGHDHETDDGTMERLEKRLRRRWITDE